jgi:hypothetical protein
MTVPRFRVTTDEQAKRAVDEAFNAGRRVGALDVEREVVRHVDAAIARGDVSEAAVRRALLGRSATRTPSAPKPKRKAATSARPMPRPPGAPRRPIGKAAAPPPGAVRVQLFGGSGESTMGYMR